MEKGRKIEKGNRNKKKKYEGEEDVREVTSSRICIPDIFGILSEGLGIAPVH